MANAADDGCHPVRRTVVLLGIGVKLIESRTGDRLQVVMMTATMLKTALTAINITDRIGNHAAPVRDSVGYRNTVPQHVARAEIGKLTAVKFGWKERNTVSLEMYVKGVVAGHDFTRRELLDGLRGFLRDQPTNPEEARRRWMWLAEWAETQPRPRPLIRTLKIKIFLSEVVIKS